jgi:hypothetical protein
VKLPAFLDPDKRELAAVGQEAMSGSDWFWAQFFAILLIFAIPAAIAAYTPWKPLGVDWWWWALAGTTLATIWAGAQKFWDEQKRKSVRLSSLAFEGIVSDRHVEHIPATQREGEPAYPELVMYREAVSSFIHYVFRRGWLVVNRADAIFRWNKKRIISGTTDKATGWDSLPKHVQDAVRTNADDLNVHFRDGKPVGVRFAYGDKARYARFMDEEYAIDVAVEAQRETESSVRTTTERVTADMKAATKAASRHHALSTMKGGRKAPPSEEEQEPEEEGGLG